MRKSPELTDAGLEAAVAVNGVNEFGEIIEGHIAAERALTIYLNKREIVTLMTLGTQPELLVLGWLRNQRLVKSIDEVKAIQVDWETESVAVTTHDVVDGLDEKLSKKTVTTGCGQGTVYGDMMEGLDKIKLPKVALKQSLIYELLANLNKHNEIYKQAGAVHGCALCRNTENLRFVEDVGRHNAVDAIAGYMWLHDIQGNDKIFYTTGRLTSEMVIKVAQMGIPVLLSRSGATQMGYEIAQQLGVVLISRAKGKHFLVYNGAEQIEFDAIPNKLKSCILMSKPQTFDVNTPFLSVKQVAEYLQLNEKKVYSLANEGHIPATKVTGKWMFPRELIDRWMLDSSHSGLLKDRLIIAGSDDPLLYRVVNNFAAQMGSRALISYSPTGTGIGLNLLQSQRIDVCGMHWGPQAESGMRHPALLQQHAQYKHWVLIRAFQREQGLIINPRLLKISKSPEAFFDNQYRWAMRQKGSGAQRFLLEILSHYPQNRTDSIK